MSALMGNLGKGSWQELSRQPVDLDTALAESDYAVVPVHYSAVRRPLWLATKRRPRPPRFEYRSRERGQRRFGRTSPGLAGRPTQELGGPGPYAIAC